MDIDQLTTEYVQYAHWQELPPYLRAFYLGLEQAGISVEVARITPRTEETHETRIALVTSHGLATISVEHRHQPPGFWEHVVSAKLCDWRSIHGAELSYAGNPDTDGTQWTVTVHATPELSLTSGDFADRDGSKTRAFAAAVLAHLQ